MSTISDYLTSMSHAGSFTSIGHVSSEDLEKISLHIKALKATGHAISADETFSYDHKPLGITVTHYLTCLVCRKGPK